MQRIDNSLTGREVDRIPVSFWYDFDAQQLAAIGFIARGPDGVCSIIDTVFDPWQVLLRNLAEEHLGELHETDPDALLRALDVITDNVIGHCREAFRAGCDGISVEEVTKLPAAIPSHEDRDDSKPSIAEVRAHWNSAIMACRDKNKVARVTPAEAIVETVKSSSAT